MAFVRNPQEHSGVNRLSVPLSILATIALGFAMHEAARFLIWVATTFLLFAIVDPSVRTMQKRRVSPVASAFLLITFICLSVGLIFLLLASAIESLMREFPVYREAALRVYRALFHAFTPQTAIAQSEGAQFRAALMEISRNFGRTFVRGLANLMTVLSYSFLCPLLTFFLILERATLMRVLYLILRRDSERAAKIWGEVTASASAFFYGNLVLTAGSFVLFMVLFERFGITTVIPAAVVASIVNIIPFIGGVLAGLIPALNIVAHEGALERALWVYSACFAIHFFFANLITPKLIGPRLSLNATTSLLAAIGFGELWGIAGLFLAIPLASAMKIAFQNSRDPRLRSVAKLMGEQANSNRP